MNTTTVKKIIWLTAFSIAMGYMESAVVVYLRQLFYPSGFGFPLTPINPHIAATEFFREAATVIMLAAIGILTGRSRTEKFAIFIYCFAIWDIFYYVFLKVILDWPATLLDWDILFLIPVPWVGPVLAPVIVSFTLILFALLVVFFEEKKRVTKINRKEKILMYTGCGIIIISFMWDYVKFVFDGKSSNGLWTITSKENLFSEVANYVPRDYSWTVFSIGEIILLTGILLYYLRMKK